jgi:hypothetical protein
LAGKEARFFELVKHHLTGRGWPYAVQPVDVGGGLFSQGRPYLETKAGKLVGYIGAESTGKDAYLVWSLALNDPGVFKRAMAAAGNFSAAIFQEMSFNEANSARAFASSLNRCVQEAVDSLMDEAGIDKTQVSREASGLLGRLI